MLVHDRRRVVHFNVTAHPTAEWAAQQIVEAFPFDSAPKYLLRDRDRIYGHEFQKQVEVMGIEQVLSAPRSPWQRAYVERIIGSITPGVFGSCHHLRRRFPAAHAALVFFPLPSLPPSPGLG